MANIKISQLSAASTLSGTELIPTVQSGTTVRTTIQAISNLALNSWSGSTTSQFAGTASLARTASFVPGTIFTSTNRALSASYALTASYTLGGGGWSLTGNAGLSPSTNFIGTTDANDLIFKVNSVEYLKLNPVTSSNEGVLFSQNVKLSRTSSQIWVSETTNGGYVTINADSNDRGKISIARDLSNYTTIKCSNITGIKTLQLPNSSGTLVAFPYTGSAIISGSLTIDGPTAITNLFSGSNFDSTQLISVGTLNSNSAIFSGSFANRFLPVGYNTYNIYFNENSGGSNTVKLWDPSILKYTGPITIASNYSSQTTTIKDAFNFTVATLSADQQITLYYDHTLSSWSVLNRGRVNETILSSGTSFVTQSVTGSLRITGSLLVNGSSVAAAFPFNGNAIITGSLVVSGSGLTVTGSINTTKLNGNIGLNDTILAVPQVNSSRAIYPGGLPTSTPIAWNDSFPNYYQSLFPSLQPYYLSNYSSTSGGNTITVTQGHLGIGTYVDVGFGTSRKLESIYLYVSQSTQGSAPTTLATSVTRTIISDNNTLETSFYTIPSVATLNSIATANGRVHVLTVTGSMLARDSVSLGTNISNNHIVTGSVAVTGSVTINSILKLQPRNTTPASAEEGMIIASGSVGASKLFYYDGTVWNALF